MNEAAFPVLGTVFVVLVVLPLCALLAKVSLLFLERDGGGGPLHGLNLRYLLLTGSSTLPLAWLLSAGLHQSESGLSAFACLFDHGDAAFCFEPGFFALTLALVAAGSALSTFRAARRIPAARTPAATALLARIDQIVSSHGELRALRGLILATEHPDFAVGVQGWIKPLVMVGTAFAARLSDEMLASALGHENEHVQSRDPLRFWVLRLALAVNPFGRRLLESHAARWIAAREAHCDREAVIHGSLPLPLADAIVHAARPSVREAVALGARDTVMLKFRVAMLLAFAEQAPVRCCQHKTSGFPMVVALLALAVLLPHQAGTAALDALHTGAERALLYFWQ